MTHSTDHDQERIAEGRIAYERFAAAEVARLEQLVAAAQVETRAYGLISQIYAHLERSEVTPGDAHDDPKTDVRQFWFPDGLVGRVSGYSAIELGHYDTSSASAQAPEGKYIAGFRIYTHPDSAFDTVRAADLDPTGATYGITADMSLPMRGVEDLAFALLAASRE